MLNSSSNQLLFSFSQPFLSLICIVLATGGHAKAEDKEIRFNRDVRPILAEYCLACHGFDGTKREAGLRLDTSEGATAELDSGEVAIRPNDVESSELLRRIFTEDEGTLMPPPEGGKKLTLSQKETLRLWIAQGAKYEAHWSFAPPESIAPPPSKVSSDFQNPIDQFIHSKLEQRGLPVSPRAAPYTLIRRVSLDLVGLPPTPEEVRTFEDDYKKRGTVAYTDLVDRLLRSPHYGEKWGRWWLDAARYSDSNGYSVDAPRSIWLYRDWVVRALNSDMPFDQFTVEQLAGDLLPSSTPQQKIATGFHRNTQINEEGGIDPEQFRIESIFDRVATTGTVFLGLTIGCAQCHNHKFDPISQREYYQLFAFFNDQDEPEYFHYPPEINAKRLQAEKKHLEEAQMVLLKDRDSDMEYWIKGLDPKQKEALGKDLQKSLAIESSKRNLAQREAIYLAGIGKDDEEAKGRRSLIATIDKSLAKGIKTLILRERDKPRNTTVYIQGDFTRPDEPVQPRTLSVLHPFTVTDRRANRLDLAHWIVAKDNPLTARVVANRVWQQYFGRGIVETENDFGLQGAVPSHPELLDWLAGAFVEDAWSLKKLHRKIVCSDTYVRSSNDRTDLKEVDRDNYLLARQRRLRLDAELVRDVGLASSGLLSLKLGGPPVFPPIPDGVMGQGQVKREWKESKGEDRYRRGLYTFSYRATPPPALTVFDAPEGNTTCTRRIRSNTPLQALTLLNDAGYFEFAKSLQALIEQKGIDEAFLRCTSRLPTPQERTLLSGLDALSAARVLLNLDETVTRE